MKVLKFWAEWCQPCKLMEAKLKEIGLKYDNIDVEDSENADLVTKYSIRSLPTVIVLDDEDKECQRFIGASVDYIKTIKELCSELITH